MPQVIEVFQNLKNYFEAREELKQPFYIKLNKSIKTEKASDINNLQGETMRYQNKTIFKTPGAKTWYTRYRDTNGQHYISGKTQKEVYEKLKKITSNSDVNANNKIMPTTLKEWIDNWYTLYKSELRQRSIIELHAVTDKIPKSLLTKQIKDFTAVELNNFINFVPGARTKQRRFTIINDIFDKAYKNDLINKNPMSTLKKPKYEAIEKEVLTQQEEQLLLSKIKSSELYIYAIAVLQGLRPGELLALQYNNIDLKNMTISITKSIDEITNDTDVKNKYSNRVIPLFKKTYEIIKDIDTTSNEKFAKHSMNITNDKLKELLKDITDKKITLYNLRHTFITRMQDKNIAEHIIQSWVGHGKNSKITKKVYTHVTSETEIKYINILNNE